MSIPDWLSEIFAGVTLLVAAMSAGQLAVARAWIHRGAADTDITLFHLLLGIAMAGLLAADLHTLPNSAWDVVFAVTTAWFDWCLWRDSRKYGAAAAIGGQYAPQLTYSAAMLYMFTALAKTILRWLRHVRDVGHARPARTATSTPPSPAARGAPRNSCCSPPPW